MNLMRSIGLGVGLTAAAVGVMLAGDVARLVLPEFILNHQVEWTFAALLIGRLAMGRGLGRVDAFSSWMIGRGLFLALAAWTCVRLAAWLPHYPSWPWCRDVDVFALLAMHWDAGELPYRDVRAYNFPGHIYLHWLLGRLFGWGRPGLFYVVDAAAVLTLGGALLAWGRRRLGGPLPGVFSYFVFLAAYFDMQIEYVAERDWHAALGATLAILTLQAWPGRPSRWLSALLLAGACTIRPHVVLFLPALALAVVLHDREDVPRGLRAGAARLAEWGCAFALFLAAGFAPLAIAGVLDDLARSLAMFASGGPYSTLTAARALDNLAEELRRPTLVPLLLSLGALSFRGPMKAEARAWLAALLGAMAYRPISPVAHEYLKTPLILVEAVAWAVPVAWCASQATAGGAGRRATVGLLAVLFLLYQSVPTREPYNCSFPAVADALRAAARSGWPDVPPGAYVWFAPERHPRYPWDDYQRVLKYLREETGPDAMVANVLKNMPLPPVNGPAGRRSPFRVEAGITWMWMIHEDLDGRFAGELQDAGADSVVVWVPAEADAQVRLPLRKLNRVIHGEYRPEARFGPIEVWRRKPAAGP